MLLLNRLLLLFLLLASSIVAGQTDDDDDDDIGLDANSTDADASAAPPTSWLADLDYAVGFEPGANSSFNVSAPPEPVRTSFEKFISVVGPGTFFLLALMTGIGNTLIIIVILLNRSMHNFQNILVVNFALAEILFVGICMPFITVDYAGTRWPFSEQICKGVTYAANVTSYASVYILLLLAGDRYVAATNVDLSNKLRKPWLAFIAIVSMWGILGGVNLPILWAYSIFRYDAPDGVERSTCTNIYAFIDPGQNKVVYGCFGAFSCPLMFIVILYCLIIRHLIFCLSPGPETTPEEFRGKKTHTRAQIVVLFIFNMVWLPIQMLLLVQYMPSHPGSKSFITIQVITHCLIFTTLNVNPLLFIFLTENFRHALTWVLFCGKITATGSILGDDEDDDEDGGDSSARRPGNQMEYDLLSPTTTSSTITDPNTEVKQNGVRHHEMTI